MIPAALMDPNGGAAILLVGLAILLWALLEWWLAR